METRGTVRSPLDGADKSWKNSTIAVRSSRDRTSFIAESIHDCQTTFSGESGARSTPDRGTIVVDRGAIMVDRGAIVVDHGENRGYDEA